MVQLFRVLGPACPGASGQSSMNTVAADMPLVCFDGSRVRIEDVVALARRQRRAQLSRSSAFVDRISRGADFLDRLLSEEGVIYGVTTGYGDSCTVSVPAELVPELPHHLYAYHGCGSGRFL